MSLLDGVLILLGMIAVLWGTYRQLLGTLLSFLSFYFTLLVAGALVGLMSDTYGVGARLVRSLWGEAASFRLIEVGLFILLGLGAFIALEVGNRFVFPNPGLAKLGIWDSVFGGILGALLGLALMAVSSNLWRLTVMASWQPWNTWAFMRRAYDASLLAPLMRSVLPVLNGLLFPFAFFGYPRVLLP